MAVILTMQMLVFQSLQMWIAPGAQATVPNMSEDHYASQELIFMGWIGTATASLAIDGGRTVPAKKVGGAIQFIHQG
jgi:hypothetical protein